MGLISSLLAKFSRPDKPKEVAGSIYDFKINDIGGREIDFNRYMGKNLLIVNTASRCGYTPQYADLQKLHEQYGDSLAVLGFPSNDFLWQEPGTNADIASFCQKNYGITFTIFGKVSVKGSKKHPLYQWLAAKTGSTPSWNFCKYLVRKNGDEVKFFSQQVKPLDPILLNEIRK
jgi:glutathione peroxidase